MLAGSIAPRVFPESRAGNVLPAERIPARPMRDQVVEARNTFSHARTMTRRNPPHDQRGLDRGKPFLAPCVEALMQGLPDEAFKRLDRFPDRQVWQDGLVVINAHVHGVTAVILQPPYEPGDFIGEPVHSFNIVDEFAHARIVEWISDPRNIKLS